jgi:hypothetical protein
MVTTAETISRRAGIGHELSALFTTADSFDYWTADANQRTVAAMQSCLAPATAAENETDCNPCSGATVRTRETSRKIPAGRRNCSESRMGRSRAA